MAQTQTEKLHSACDECRTRKLKCSGEFPNCSRCEREQIRCVYSPQKQMGRPRKRRREEGEPPTPAEQMQIPAGTNLSRTDSLPGPSFSDFETDVVGLSAFAQFPTPDNMVHSLGSVPHEDALGINLAQLPAPDLNFDPIIDPALWHAQPGPNSGWGDENHPASTNPNLNTPHTPVSDSGPCSCLSNMYLTLSDLQSMTFFSFPAVIPKLRLAIMSASDIVRCDKCPADPFNAIQNVLTLASLLSALAERYHKVLFEIESEAIRLEQAGKKKPFRVGDNNPALHHLHTGTLDCPMGFDVELEAGEWRRLAKKALKTEVLGGGSNLTPLTALLDQMEARQRRWHAECGHGEERERLFGKQRECEKPEEEAMCLKMINQVRTMIGRMEWE
ncbi:hypothetical protein BCR34DRAFT_264339 [Clohesyomyces aquaticus]|uniref:Zn(2)-C6 fungal-type domain-containing protein n=1 Tax=Clohesyomyces aquaticus TaxID=1231657 RepID=A0A1Y1ZTD6_9PLEO|nr:hypothetical protein BCR34DRAFT_264339 [Clohesyomyces aquaticus]